MITIRDTVVKHQKNFWNGCVFHPTDAVEDPWGKRILDQMSVDGAINTVRVYAMLEDIVYTDENGELCFDFRVSDLRLDYLVEQGFDLLLAYAAVPDCIATSTAHKTSHSNKKTRYKGKMWNTAAPRDYALWETICYEYTKHNVERYGIGTVKKWRCQCYNEPDLSSFFLGDLPFEEVTMRVQEYSKLYEAFQNAIRRVSEDIPVGGPALAFRQEFLEDFLHVVKEKSLKMDFISVHNYGTCPEWLNDGSHPYCVDDIVNKQRAFYEIVCKCGFRDTPLLVDEWGMSSLGYYNREACPSLMAREHEVFSAYYVKLIDRLLRSDFVPDKLMICLSGQHEMAEDFTGFRNFFTLNFIKKPIYNAFVMASKLKDNLLNAETDNAHVTVIPTCDKDGKYAVLVTYSTDHFTDELPAVQETVRFDAVVEGRAVTVYAIDEQHTNPYRLYQRMGIEQPTDEQLAALRAEGVLKPLVTQDGKEPIVLNLTANATYLITVD